MQFLGVPFPKLWQTASHHIFVPKRADFCASKKLGPNVSQDGASLCTTFPGPGPGGAGHDENGQGLLVQGQMWVSGLEQVKFM